MTVWPKPETLELIEKFDQEFTRIHGSLIDPRESDINDAWITEFRKTSILKSYWENYETLEQDNPNKNWRWLRQRLRDHIQSKRGFDNAEELCTDTMKRLQNHGKGAKGTTTQGASNPAGTSKGLCPFFLQGYCKFGDQCTESHKVDPKKFFTRAAKTYGIPATPAFQASDGNKGKKGDDKDKKKGKKGDDKGKSKGKGKDRDKKKGYDSDSSGSESDGEGARRPKLPLAQRPCLNIAFFNKCDNHGKKLCPYGHDQKTQADYKAGKIQGFSFEKNKKAADDIKARGDAQFTLPPALQLQQ
jgi:hypothetical protein